MKLIKIAMPIVMALASCSSKPPLPAVPQTYVWEGGSGYIVYPPPVAPTGLKKLYQKETAPVVISFKDGKGVVTFPPPPADHSVAVAFLEFAGKVIGILPWLMGL